MATTRRPLRPCTSPGCPTRVQGGRCERHAGLAQKQRQTWTEVYGSEWPNIRLDFLTRNPRCTLCPRMARVADHYPVGIRELRRRGITNPHHDRYLRPLCWPCHSRVTTRHQPGGWNASRQ